jgi:hypothetical protein
MAALGELAQAAIDQAKRRQRRSEACRNRVYWTAEEEQLLRDRYADEDTASIAQDLNRPVEKVYSKAAQLGLHKSEAYTARYLHECGLQHAERCKASRFQAGHTAWNKGMKGLQAGGRAKETQFGKGHMPHNWVPVGTERVSDGYLYRKMTDTRRRHDWKLVHVMLWEEHNGPIPEGFILCFKNGNRQRIELENLELITRAERMRRNTIHRYPPELKATMHQLRKLNKAIQEREDEKSA